MFKLPLPEYPNPNTSPPSARRAWAIQLAAEFQKPSESTKDLCIKAEKIMRFVETGDAY